jgi:ABC-type transport system involved in multi-copper enzyme maturation permease subunit
VNDTPSAKPISIASQTRAILSDAFRELNARKMFWIAMGLTALAAGCLAILGINERGLTILGWTIETFPIATAPRPGQPLGLILSEATFYKTIFIGFGFNIWISWASIILALVATASIIPDFTSNGAIENMLARPISRARLFLTKYLASLLFVLLLTSFFCALSIMIIGLRAGVWLWGLAVAIPLVTLFFSYLYCISALVGVWTRSTLAALVAALVFWGCLFGVNTFETIMLTQRVSSTQPIAGLERDIEAMRLQIAKEAESGASKERIESLTKGLERRQKTINDRRASAEQFIFWHNIAYTAKTLLPKTAETTGLIARAVSLDEEMERALDASDDNSTESIFGRVERRTQREVQKIISERSIWWIVGTSLLFQAFILALATRLFMKRDF